MPEIFLCVDGQSGATLQDMCAEWAEGLVKSLVERTSELRVSKGEVIESLGVCTKGVVFVMR